MKTTTEILYRSDFGDSGFFDYLIDTLTGGTSGAAWQVDELTIKMELVDMHDASGEKLLELADEALALKISDEEFEK